MKEHKVSVLTEVQIESLECLINAHEKQILNLVSKRISILKEIQKGEKVKSTDQHSQTPKRMKQLLHQRELIEQEIEVHNNLIALGRNANYLTIIGEILNDAKLAREVSKTPLEFAKSRGIPMPLYMEFGFTFNGDDVGIRITHNHKLAPFVLIVNKNGFSTPSLDMT